LFFRVSQHFLRAPDPCWLIETAVVFPLLASFFPMLWIDPNCPLFFTFQQFFTSLVTVVLPNPLFRVRFLSFLNDVFFLNGVTPPPLIHRLSEGIWTYPLPHVGGSVPKCLPTTIPWIPLISFLFCVPPPIPLRPIRFFSPPPASETTLFEASFLSSTFGAQVRTPLQTGGSPRAHFRFPAFTKLASFSLFPLYQA